jgi:nucleotide-binding universal stress UspA family protein
VSTILLGVDSSARSEDAVALARRLALASSADVIVASITPASGPARDEATAAATRMRTLLAGVAPDRVRTRVLAADSPARGLQELAEQEAATVIVVGSTHTGHVGRVRPGSTGERLLCGSPCAVALAPHGYRAHSDEGVARIGVAYDGSPESRAALVAANATARACDASLEVVTVVADSAAALLADAGYDLTHRTLEAEIRRDLDELVAALPGAAGIVLEGRPWQALTDYSARLDLLFAGSRGYGPLHAVIAGGTSGPLMQHARCPVVVLARGADTAFSDLFERQVTATA